ncbi:helix-turn-helix transcriptional regulator [Amnibacterium kyonggiense]|uniref:helix-turn-helix transcriptional regulator n=1 Tax=Amnibacterium kyonggiense TaxID=595671 RepID=UPI0010609831|nr:helix-turn-helix transcriptional regulator [Amnibacterium kyonggiense]
MDRAQLADFLRRHRESLTPADVGLPDGVRRRTPGLRREEVASLVGMSADYLTRLEQQRGPQPSEQMLLALARGLRLTLDERDHLFRLAGHTAPPRVLRRDHVAPPLLRVLDRLDDAAALVLSDLGETLAQNRLAVALLGDGQAHSGLARSAIHRWFTDPAERLHYPEEGRALQSRLQVAQLRAAMTAGARGQAILDDLLERSAEFRELWALHEVRRRFEDSKTLVHPEVGRVDVDCQALFTEDQAQTLLVLTPRGPEAVERMRLLGVIAGARFAV